MRRDLQKIANTDLGILIIGGGITGAGILRDAANRGIKAALVERDDFAWGTTGRSTMLVHGGLRYLENYRFRLVSESIQERKILQTIAGDITQSLPFLIPVYHGDKRSLSKIKLGLTIYDFIAGSNKLHSSKILSIDEILKEETSLSREGLTGGGIYYDCQTNPERLTIANLFNAFEHGGQMANYCEAISLLKENGRVRGAVVKDLLADKTYEIKAKTVINATGPWSDKTLGLLTGQKTNNLRPTKGIHLILPKLSEKAILSFIKSDNRAFFVIPWKNYSIVGTTDIDYNEDPDQLYVTKEEIQYLIREVNRLFPKKNLQYDDIAFIYAGIRPLICDETRPPSEISREHKIIRHQDNELYGLISVIGGKLTTYRLIAQQVVDIIHKEYKIPQERKCQTDIFPLLYQIFPSEQEAYLRLQDVFEKSQALIKIFREQIIVKASEYKFRVALACEMEMARTPADFLLRRSQIGYQENFALDILPSIADHMGDFLGWKPEEKELHINKYKTYVKSNYSLP